MSAAENFKSIRTELDDKIILVAVTKNHGVELMREAIDAGATDIGENRVQEAAEKFPTHRTFADQQSQASRQALRRDSIGGQCSFGGGTR